MSYVAVRGLGAQVAPPPDATSQALGILAACAIPCLPIAGGIASGMYIGKGKSAVAPILGGLVGGIISVLYLRSSVLAGNSAMVPRATA